MRRAGCAPGYSQIRLSWPNIILVGFMGTGKTSVGRLLAGRAGMKFVDLDDVIVEKTGLAISEIFNSFGEPYFRFMEKRLLEETCRGEGLVIAAGGGTMCDPRNRSVMKKAGIIVCLAASAQSIRRRLKGDDTRPLLAGRRQSPNKRMEDLLEERKACYGEADITVTTDRLTPEEVAEKILGELTSRDAKR